MAKINEDAFNRAGEGAALKTGTQAKPTRNLLVYDIPTKWLDLIRENSLGTGSGYIRQALREKLQRDGVL